MRKPYLVIYFVLALILLAAPVLISCASTPAPSPTTTTATTAAPVKVIELKYASSNSNTHPQSIADIAWMEKINKDTNGRVKVTPYWGGALMKSADSLIELAKGVADIAEFSGAYVKEGYDIEKSMRILFFGSPSPEISRKVYDEVRAKYPQIDQEFKSIKPMAYHSVSPYQVFTLKKPIKSTADFKGMIFKVTGDFGKLASAFGGQGVTVPMADTYVALQKGTVDGAFAPLETLKSFNFGEVVKYITELGMSVGPTPHRGFNLNSFNNLPPDIQKIVNDSVLFWGEKIDEELFKADAVGLDFAKKNGAEYIKMSPEEIAKFYVEVDKLAVSLMVDLDKKGLPGTAMYKDIRAGIAKYSK